MSMNDCEPINFAINAESLQRRLRNVEKKKAKAVNTHSDGIERSEKLVNAGSTVILSAPLCLLQGLTNLKDIPVQNNNHLSDNAETEEQSRYGPTIPLIPEDAIITRMDPNDPIFRPDSEVWREQREAEIADGRWDPNNPPDIPHSFTSSEASEEQPPSLRSPSGRKIWHLRDFQASVSFSSADSRISVVGSTLIAFVVVAYHYLRRT